VSQSITLLVLGVVMAVVVGWLLKQTFNVQPWVAEGIEDAHPTELSSPPVKIGLWVFLAVVTSLFALFISAYAMRMRLGDWRPLPEPWLLWLNTGVLVLTSATMQWTWAAANRGQTDAVKSGLLAGGVLTFAFLAGQLAVWRQLGDSGYLMASNPANAYFYVLTALHALHVLGGLVAWGRTSVKAWRGAKVAEVRLGVELCTLYWHFLLLVWLVLFALLLST